MPELLRCNSPPPAARLEHQIVMLYHTPCLTFIICGGPALDIHLPCWLAKHKGPLPFPMLGRLPTDNILLALQLTWGLHVDDYTQAQCCACREPSKSQVWRHTLVQLMTEHLVRLCMTHARHLKPLVSLLSDSDALLSWPLLVVNACNKLLSTHWPCSAPIQLIKNPTVTNVVTMMVPLG